MPTNQSHYRQWTIGSTFYPMLVLAEAFGSSGKAQVVDLYMNSNYQYTPGYVIYEDGNPDRVVLINYLTDSTGASNYTAYISIGGNSTGMTAATPSSVQVKYLLASSAADKFGITWAGQVRLTCDVIQNFVSSYISFLRLSVEHMNRMDVLLEKRLSILINVIPRITSVLSQCPHQQLHSYS